LLKEIDNYEWRARIMYAATCALNEITMFGRKGGDWGVHGLGHTFSLLYDIPHGATLSAVYPAWLKLMSDRIPERIQQFGKAVFGVDSIEETISKTTTMFRSFLSPVSLDELKIENYDEQKVFEAMTNSRASGYFHKLGEDDYRKILALMKQ
jgi:alcohol dehydrogenase YqhD (iron-dependent ADH family)